MGSLATILKYAKYIPLLLDLVAFIREAEKAFRGADTGSKKLEVVRLKLTDLVTTLEVSGVLTAKLADAIRGGAGAIISIIVQLMNAEQGGVDDGDGDNVGGGPKPSGKYLMIFNTMPDLIGYKAGDEIWRKGDEDKWMATQKGVGVGRPRDPWHVVHVVG